MQNARALVLMGSHLGENMHNTQVQDFAEAMGNGCELIVVDPRFSIAAGKAKHWLPIRPGTDIALLLGWMHVILREGWYDKNWVEANCTGLEELKKHVASYYPEAVYVETGISPEQLVATARAMTAAAPHALIHPGRRTTWYGDDVQRMRAVAMLNALLGNWGQPGGFVMTTKSELKGQPGLPEVPEGQGRRRPDAGRVSSRQRHPRVRHAQRNAPPEALPDQGVDGLRRQPADDLPQREGDARGDPAARLHGRDRRAPERSLWLGRRRAARGQLPRAPRRPLEPLLPRALHRACASPSCRRSATRSPAGGSPSSSAKRLGLDEYFAWKTPLDLVQKRLQASGYKAEDFKTLCETGVIKTAPVPEYLPQGEKYEFGTPSGKIELHSQQLAALGQDPIPVYRRPEMPSGEQLRLLVGRAPTHTFGRTTNNALLLQAYDENDIWVHHDVAERIGVEERRLRDAAEPGRRARRPDQGQGHVPHSPDCAYMVHGFGHKAKKLRRAHKVGADDNALMTRYATDPLAGTTGINVNFVTLEKVEA